MIDMLYRHPKTNIISCFIVLDILTSLGINSSEELQWITNRTTVNICKGHTLDMNWQFDAKGKEISMLEWYFNDILICVLSGKDDFKIELPYQDRIERFGESGIRLKNISLDDEGTFTLLPVLSWATSESMQSISLQVSEPPTDMCMVKISVLGNTSKLMCDVSSSDCGRPQMSAVWKRSKTFEVLGEGNYIEINSSFYDKEILCCPQGKAIDCVGDSSHRFCVSIPLRANESPSKNVPHSCDTDWSKLHDAYSFILLVICVIVSSVATTFSILSCRQMRALEQTVLRLAKNQAADSTSVLFSEQASPLTEMTEEAYPTRTKLTNPEHETEELITEHQTSTNSETTRQLQELREGALCKICFANKINMLFMPCNHIAACYNCSNSLQQCPVCRILIEDKKIIHFGCI